MEHASCGSLRSADALVVPPDATAPLRADRLASFEAFDIARKSCMAQPWMCRALHGPGATITAVNTQSIVALQDPPTLRPTANGNIEPLRDSCQFNSTRPDVAFLAFALHGLHCAGRFARGPLRGSGIVPSLARFRNASMHPRRSCRIRPWLRCLSAFIRTLNA
jgi:hypothetical protein